MRGANKYGARRTVTPDGTFDSQGEAQRWGELRVAERAGFVRNLRRQVECVLREGNRSERVVLRWDFAYQETVWTNGTPAWVEVREDFKGMVTPLFTVKRKWHAIVHPAEVVVLSSRKGRKVVA